MTVAKTMPEIETTKRLTGKVALVTGGSRGIGAAIASRIAKEGASVALTYSKNKEAAEKVVETITGDGAKAIAYQADASVTESIDELSRQLEKQFGRIDILINNAGVWAGSLLEEIDIEQYNYVFDVNVKGLIATTKATLPLMSDGGRIINISSGASTYALPGVSIYSASKAAVDALTRSWAQELGYRNITVNTVAPGLTDTDMMHEALPDEAQSAMIEKTALGRVGTGDDIASLVAFLASDDGRWVTGQYIKADGGIS